MNCVKCNKERDYDAEEVFFHNPLNPEDLVAYCFGCLGSYLKEKLPESGEFYFEFRDWHERKKFYDDLGVSFEEWRTFTSWVGAPNNYVFSAQCNLSAVIDTVGKVGFAPEKISVIN